MNTKIKIEKNISNFTNKIDTRVFDSLHYITNQYDAKEDFYNCYEFANNLFGACSIKNINDVAINSFVSGDTFKELVLSVNLTSICIYKSAFDSLRRSLEISLIGCYFATVKNGERNFWKWIDSDLSTPFFTNALDEISKVGIFNELKNKFNWNSEILNIYHNLCDYSHTKGQSKSILNLNKSEEYSLFNPTPIFNETSEKDFLDRFIEVVKMIAVIYAISNPILLIGLPVFEKFGFSSFTGLFNKEQSSNLLKILPEKYKTYLLEFIGNNMSIQNKIINIMQMTNSDKYKEISEIINEAYNIYIKKI